ncbi:PqqD family peptide modification chaperone [Aquincola sp. MAHUQ-54]|uniref:PqqD family peptide modification chaperone n=1 Tax=Aquincola agrisoli TaxID=3119538 RepID=A0AAW9QQ03_9BURK
MTTHGQALSSTHWWRVAPLKPRLRGHVQIHRHVYRGRTWYVVEDRVAAKFYRFNFASYRVIDLFDGRRSLQEVWDRLAAEIGEDTPTQEEVVQLLGQLHTADLLQFDVTPDAAELLERRGKERRKRFIGRFLNPMSIRFPLFDPDRFLAWLARVMQPLLGWPGALLWIAAVLPALLLVPSHWPDLTQNFGEQLLAADNLLLMALVFPLLKACHELGHGLALKRRGSEVHEMGVMLLVFFPVPYVDASGASAYADKRDRMLVGAAGMLAEIFLAALAFYAWLLLEPGLARSLAYNVVVIGSVTTVLFNANPLLRYDGYYVLMDAIEVPNLGQRANRFWLRMIEERVFGVPPSPKAEAADLPAERRWFWFYAPAALVYRLSVSLGIALFIATEYFFFGVAMALWTVGSSIVWPLGKGLAALWREPRFRARATRVRAVLAGTVAVAGIALFVVPMPHHTHAEGVVWAPEDAILRAGGSGFVTRLRAEPGDRIEPGQVLLESVDPELRARLAEQEAKREEAQSRVDAAWGVAPARAGQLQDALHREHAALQRLQDDAALLTLRARAGGELMAGTWHDLPQRYVKKGEVLGYVVGEYVPVVRVVVQQDGVDPVRLATRAVEVKLPQAVGQTLQGRLLREVPKAGTELPSAALGQRGGGEIALDPSDEKGLKALKSVFEFEVELPPGTPVRFLGSRAWVRFAHPAEPIGQRWLRGLRRLFLSHFGV